MDQQNIFPLWVSHSSMADFLNCPRTYYLRHVYKDPKTQRKINIISPALALGNVVHEVLEKLYELPVEERFRIPLLELFNASWVKVAGKAGGFRHPEEELEFKNRGALMVRRVMDNPGPLQNKAVPFKSKDKYPPHYLFSEKENIVLNGKVDWLEYLPEDDAVHIIDFKTGTRDEKPNSLQLPIYSLLVKHCQKRLVKKMSYWYLETEDKPREMVMPDEDVAEKAILGVALQIKKARLEGKFTCLRPGGCFACRPLEHIVAGKAEFIRTSGYQDIYAVL